MIRSRQQLVRWGLADALDLMVISIEAGLGLNAAMMKVSSELKEVHPDISDEFELANLEIRVGRERDEALRNLAERTGVEDLRSLVAMLIQTDKFGTSIAKAHPRVFRFIAHQAPATRRTGRAKSGSEVAVPARLFSVSHFVHRDSWPCRPATDGHAWQDVKEFTMNKRTLARHINRICRDHRRHCHVECYHHRTRRRHGRECD